MVDSDQGGRSSRPRPAKKDRQRMRILDRKISRLDQLLKIRRVLYDNNREFEEKRMKLDLKRKLLRRKMKGYSDV